MLEDVYAGALNLRRKPEARVFNLRRKRWEKVKERKKRGNERDRSLGFV